MSGGTVQRMLIAVDDSTESLAAARTGARFAASWGATVRIVNVIADGTIDAVLAERGEANAEAQRGEAANRLLAHVVREARREGVPAERIDAVLRLGEPFRRILEEAETWRADLIVMAVNNRVGLRSPYIGSATEHVLEFATVPVLVIPSGDAAR